LNLLHITLLTPGILKWLLHSLEVRDPCILDYIEEEENRKNPTFSTEEEKFHGVYILCHLNYCVPLDSCLPISDLLNLDHRRCKIRY
jgi:hypothetical protein